MNKIKFVIGMILMLITLESDAKSSASFSVVEQHSELTTHVSNRMETNCCHQRFIGNKCVSDRLDLKRQIKPYQRNTCQRGRKSDISAFITKPVLYFPYQKINVLKTKGQFKAHVFATQKPKRIKLSCQGSKSDEWRIRMNLKTKRMRVNLKNLSEFSVLITYFRWDDGRHKRMNVIAGKGKKRVKATLEGGKSCRLDFSKRRYTYSIHANIARTTYLSGCCSDISP